MNTIKNRLSCTFAFFIVFLITSSGSESHQPFQEKPPQIYFPFQISIDPMERLLLINFENDPDSVYVGFEPQFFDDAVNGTGLLVIGWRVDGFVDVYHQPGLHLSGAKYDIAGKGLGTMTEMEMKDSYFRMDEKGVHAAIGFNDLYNRWVDIEITENSHRTRKPFGLLAPMGEAAVSPSSMPMIMLHDFYFVRRKDTRFAVTINNRQHKPDLLPMPIDRQKMYFTRYCPNPLIATLNPAQNGNFYPLNTLPGNDHEIVEFKFINGIDRTEVEAMTVLHKEHSVSVYFHPPVPDVARLKKGERISGRFAIEGHPSVGRIAGTYFLLESEGKVLAGLNPSRGWKPRPNKFSLRFLYTVAGVFKNWPKSYYWNAEMDFNKPDGPFIHSGWERKNIK
jgi:hypothetical protein